MKCFDQLSGSRSTQNLAEYTTLCIQAKWLFEEFVLCFYKKNIFFLLNIQNSFKGSPKMS